MDTDRPGTVTAVDNALRQALADALAVLDRHGAAEIATEVSERLAIDDAGLPTLVVCGEAKRGKSTLVNGLLGRPSLSPVDVDVKTAAYITFRPAADGAPEQAHITFDDGGSRAVPLEELGDWVALGGPGRSSDRGVVGAVVDLAETMLEGVVLVDTPGVGGLDSSHTRLALHAIGDGDALLFVTDAGSELTRPELHFLEVAAERIDRVVFAVAKRDKHPRTWQAVVDRNRALLREHAQRFATAPMIAVSALLAEQATAETDAQVRELLWRRSGLADLYTLLRIEVVEARRELAARNAARLVLGRLTELEEHLARQVAAARAEPGIQEQAEEERAVLQRLREDADHWQHDLNRDIERARAVAQDDLEQTFADLQERWSERIAGLDGRALVDEVALEALAADFQGSLIEGSTLVIERHIERAGQVTQDLARSLDLPPSHLPDPADALAFRRDLHVQQARKRSSGTGQQAAMIQAGIMGTGVGLKATAALSMVTPVGGVVITAGAAYGVYRLLKRLRDREQARGELQQWVRETIGRARTSTRLGVDAVFREVRPELIRAVQRHVKDRLAELSEVINEAQRAVQKDRTERQARAAGLEAQRKAVVAQRERLDGVLMAPGRRAQPPSVDTVGTSG